MNILLLFIYSQKSFPNLLQIVHVNITVLDKCSTIRWPSAPSYNIIVYTCSLAIFISRGASVQEGDYEMHRVCVSVSHRFLQNYYSYDFYVVTLRRGRTRPREHLLLQNYKA